MVLTELGAKLSSALRKLGESPVVDEEVLAELLKEVAAALLQADVRVQLVKQFRDNIKAKVNIAELPAGTNRQNLIKTTVFEELVSMVNPGRKPYAVKRRKPNVVMFVGLQGAGKTTTVAKYALHYQRLKFKTCMVCADTFRAGAFEQLKQNALRVRVPFYGNYYEPDPVKIAKEGVDLFRSEGQEVIIVDTSGRHKQESALFEEMQQVAAAISPDEIIFVMDSTIGQAAEEQAKAFKSAVPVGSVIMTKLDGHAKGGGALSAVAATGSPITFIGSGERMDDLQEFDPQWFVSQLLGWGNVKGLMQKVSTVFTPELAKDLMTNISKGVFTLRDMYEQFKSIQKLGPMSQIMSMLPGNLSSLMGNDADGAARIKKFMVIMDSMTADELDGKKKIDDPRLLRIARGSGSSPLEVDALLKAYKQFEKMFSKMGKSGLMKGTDANMATQLARNPNAVMQQLQRTMDPRMLAQVGGANGMMDFLKQMGKMDPAMLKAMGGMGGGK